MSRFLTLIPFLAARSILSDSADLKYQVKNIPVTGAEGMVTAEPVYARLTIPVCAVSQKDGFAVSSCDTVNATDRSPLQLSEYNLIDTGSYVPDQYDSVIALEDAGIINKERIEIIKPARPGQNIKKSGSEIKTGRMVIPEGHLIIPEDIGCLISCGCLNIRVRQYTAGIIPTGDELIDPFAAPAPGEVIESNCYTMAGYFRNMGIEPLLYPVTPDEPDKIKCILEQAVNECNFVIVIGGTSAGTKDHTSAIIRKIGRILFHGVAIRPGKTMLAGIVDDVLVFGLPGLPAASLTILRQLIVPWLRDKGYPVRRNSLIRVKIAESIPSDSGTDDFIYMLVGKTGDNISGVSASRGKGQFSTVQANGILHICREREGCEAGSIEEVELFRPYPDTENVLLLTGLYDPILDFLEILLRRGGISLALKEGIQEQALLSIIRGDLSGGIIKRRYVHGEYRLESVISLPPGLASIITIVERSYPSDLKNDIDLINGPELMKRSIDLIINNKYINTPQLSVLKKILLSEEWRISTGSMPGYSAEKSGTLIPACRI